jgi:hypothetical protein
MVHWLRVFYHLTVPFVTYDATLLYSLACLHGEYVSMRCTCLYTTKCQSPFQSAASQSDTDSGLCCADVDSKQASFFLFYLKLKLVSVSQRYGSGSFLSPTFSDPVPTTTANLQQACPDQHFPPLIKTKWTTFKGKLSWTYKQTRVTPQKKHYLQEGMELLSWSCVYSSSVTVRWI